MGDGGSDGSVGDGGVSDSTSSSDSSSVSVGDFGGFGDNASLSNADAATAAATSAAVGDFGSLNDFGSVGIGVPGAYGGYGSLGDNGSLGGLGIGNAPSAGSVGGVGGFGGFGSPGGFGNTGISDPSDAGFGGIAGIGPSAAAMGLGPSNGLGVSPGAMAGLSSDVGAALGTLGESIGTPAAPAQAAMATGYGNLAAGINSQQASLAAATAENAPDFGQTFGHFSTPTTTSPAVTAIDAAIAPQPSFTVPAPTTPTNAELGIPDAPIGLSPAQSIAAAQAALAAQNNTPGPTGANIGFAGFSPSPAGTVGVAPGINTGFAGFSPSPATAAAPSTPSETAAAPAAASSVTAALTNAVNTNIDFGINPTGSILLAQYPWLAFQPSA